MKTNKKPINEVTLTTEITMADLTIHTKDSAPEASKDLLEIAQAKYGFIPNLLGEMAEAPSLLKAYLTVGEALEASSLTAQEQQVVILTVSYLNECSYCMTAHSAVAKMVGLPDDEIDALREGQPMSDAKLEVLRTFTGILVEKRGGASDKDVAAFLTAGYTWAQVLEVILGIAFKTMSNLTNHVADTPIDKQFAPFTREPAGRAQSAA